MIIKQSPNRVINIDNQDFLYFGGTSYLGLQTNADFQNIIVKNILHWGSSYGSSRLANISISAYNDCEKYFANFIQCEASLTVSSGMLAGKIVVNELQKTQSVFYHFLNNHEAINIKNSLPFFENGTLNENLLNNKPENIVILVDAVLSGAVYGFDVSILDNVSVHKKITLVIDESHSIGILGINGGGLFSEINHPKIYRKISIASLGKAMGVTGGIVASDSEFIKLLYNNAIFGSSAGMNPAFAASLPDAHVIFYDQFQKLKNNLNFLKENLLPHQKLLFNHNYPLIYPKIDHIFDVFLNEKIVITHFNYPNSKQILNRIVVTANHSFDDLEKLISVLNFQLFKKND